MCASALSVCGLTHHSLVLTGCREKPSPVLLAEVHDLEGKHVTGRGLLRCSHHSKVAELRVTPHIVTITEKLISLV